MGYTFKSLCIRNFKYITNNKPLKFDFMNSNIVILDGQNGYGKTTLFDAIEVLVTGKIKHFNPSLQNRKTETLGILANDVNKDIVISAILVSDVSDEIRVERKLLCKNEFQSIITLNNQEVSQKELYDKFHLSSNMFDIGTYISQSESLDFLQNKYKNRKDAVSSLLDNTEITDKIQMLKSVQEHILGRVEKEIKDKEKQIDEISQKVNEIKRQTDHIVMNAELPGENIRLFDELRKLKRDCEEYKKKTEDMTDAIKILISKYEDANKEYQTQLLNAIKIPLMVYSGRIIQNYPLGLGIRAIIKTNQLVFEAASKSGSDVYNILSTGQLNGLSIALLLSIKNVYGDTKGLDILLIDDPLQTIDDISAISLADLLTQQGIGQIVLSTHEETKAALLRYKFKHAGMSVREQNMQALYMKTVTEE